MQTRLRRVCAAIIEAGWLLALIVTPLFFNTYSSRVFEPDKLHLLRSIALIMAVAWLVELLDGGRSRETAERVSVWSRLRGTPLVLPTLVLVLAYIISTLFSLVPGISFFGSYVRLQGTFTFLSYVAIFGMVLTHLRTRAQLNRLIHTIILTSLPITVYALMQHYGLDPLPWGGDVQERVAANMGNAIFVAAYMIMAFFLTLERLIDSVAAILREDHFADVLRALVYMFVLGLQVITIVFTQSRGPQIGLFAGLAIFGFLGLRLLGRWAQTTQRAPGWMRTAARPAVAGLVGLYLGLLVVALALVAFIVVLNVPHGPLAGLRDKPYISRMSTLLSTTEGTNAVRVLIWEGVVDMMLKPHAPIEYPAGTPAPAWAGASGSNSSTPTPDILNPLRWLIGYGPESMWVAYNNFYPPDLAHFEARNASPDRSHNETFDALVRTGALGLLAQLVLFSSIFYFALRWLGLIGSRSRRNLFVGLLVLALALGVILPAVLDHSLRLAGIVLPLGMIAALVMLYVPADLLLSTFSASASPAAEHGPVAALAGRRQLLILAIFAALVAHFVEIHTGIAIAATLTHFWVLSAVLVVVGMGWLRETEEPALAALATESDRREIARALPAVMIEGQAAGHAQPAAVAERHNGGRAQPATLPVRAGARGKRAEAPRGQGAPGRGAGQGQTRERRAGQPERGPAPARTDTPSSWQVFLPYAAIAAVITMVLVWDYAINLNGLHGAFNILWTAFTTRPDPTTHQPMGSPWILILLLLTWVVGGALALAETARDHGHGGQAYRWGANAALYAGVVVLVFFIYGLWQASLTDITSLGGLDVFRHISGYLTLFDSVLLVMGLALAATLPGSAQRAHVTRWFGNLPALSLSAGIIAAVAAIFIIIDVNVQIVQADIFYKQGLAYEEAGQSEGAIVLYDQAAQMEPQEDYYYLFLGRALLEFSSQAQPGNATLPADLSQVATGNLLRVAESALSTRTREDLMRAAYAVLTGAQRLNPLNTDHTANLGRLFRTWAFARASSSVDSPNNSTLRQLVVQHPDQVDLPRLDRSLQYYQQATTLLSPHNAQLWNEQAGVHYIRGDVTQALDDLKVSVGLDQQFVQTYLLQGDMLADSGDKNGALAAYRHAAELHPNDTQVLGAVGVYSAQVGDVQGALAAFKQVSAIDTAALASTQAALADLDAQATRAGGLDRLGAAAAQRHQQLQGQADGYRNELQMTYRNQALVLRDAGRTAEAITAAQTALANASADQRPQLEQLIADLQK